MIEYLAVFWLSTRAKGYSLNVGIVYEAMPVHGRSATIETWPRYTESTRSRLPAPERAPPVRQDLPRVCQVIRRGARTLEDSRSVTTYEQFGELSQVCAEDEFRGGVSIGIGCKVLRRQERARQAFYRRCRLGQVPGYSRFRAFRR